MPHQEKSPQKMPHHKEQFNCGRLTAPEGYGQAGRPSIPPEELLKLRPSLSTIHYSLFTIRSELQFVEQLLESSLGSQLRGVQHI